MSSYTVLPIDEIPLSLYVHIPWCERKCPYCDFNSHQRPEALPETQYVEALLHDLEESLPQLQQRPIHTIFFGGGTPSLFSADSIKALLEGIASRAVLSADCEITLEANPGTVEFAKFAGYHQAGINRLSIGVQSLQNDKLRLLGRIHTADEALLAIEKAQQAGFAQINCDLMYALPTQSLADAEFDLKTALAMGITHLSWYNLTIEPNTFFYTHPPETLPNEETSSSIETMGYRYLQAAGFSRYEISAFAKENAAARHNLNYWLFGDYLGLGAGAHSKLSYPSGLIERSWRHKTPHKYLNPQLPFVANKQNLTAADLRFEFMLMALRLLEGFSLPLFTARTALSSDVLLTQIRKAKELRLLEQNGSVIKASARGLRYLNDLTWLFSTTSP